MHVVTLASKNIANKFYDHNCRLKKERETLYWESPSCIVLSITVYFNFFVSWCTKLSIYQLVKVVQLVTHLPWTKMSYHYIPYLEGPCNL